VQVLRQLVERLAEHLPLLLRLADNLAMADMLLAFAEAANEGDYSEPQLHADAGQLLAIVKVRYPKPSATPESCLLPYLPVTTFVAPETRYPAVPSTSGALEPESTVCK
jgi:hypothetical protein